jgi:hypothetical protein
MIKIFGKKEEKKPQEELQIKRTILRGPNGKFISKKAKKAAKKKERASLVKVPLNVTFYGREIKKIYDGQNWYFCVNDIIALARPPLGQEIIKRKKNFSQVQKRVAQTFSDIIYADAPGCLELIREVDAVFPGPLARWLRESSKMPPEETPKVEAKETVNGPVIDNPSDRR